MRIGRVLMMWLGSFLVVATALLIYVRAPLVPLLVAGGLTLAVTLIRYAFPRGKQ